MKKDVLLAVAAAVIFMSAPLRAEPQFAIAMHGAPATTSSFDHFDYVNASAPQGGTLKLNANGTFDTLNPFIVRGQPAAYMTLVYESLMARNWDEPFTLYGLIAESIDVPEDRSSVVFNINPKAHWSDGQPITADDVIFSWQTLRDKGRPNHRTYYKKVASGEKIDSLHVKFAFNKNADGTIDHEMPLIMGLMPVLPKHIWENRDFNQTTLEIPVGSGPYKITAVDPGRSITYTRNQAYWGNDVPSQKGLYNFDAIHIDYYRDDSIALEAFKAGQYNLRREYDPKKWITAYDFSAAKDGRVKLEQLAHHRTEAATGFIFNTRHAIFKDPALRAALEYSFDSGWINRNLYHDQYHRTTSFFPNSELAAPLLPGEQERRTLEKFSNKLPPSIFNTPVEPPSTDGSEESLRGNLLKANEQLHAAGYILNGGRLLAPNGASVAFEILLSDPNEEKIALTWIRALQRLGIDAKIHTVDSAQYQSRLASFDFDVTTGKWINSLSPGNEQIFFWGSAAADQKGSRNYAGIKDPVVDALASAIPAAKTREELVATTHALDRVLMAGHYTIPFFYLGVDDVASWNHLQHPAAMPLYGMVLESWWYQ